MIYLDNAATTPITPKVMDVLKESMDSDFANSSAIYSIGLDARKLIERAKEDIVLALNIPSFLPEPLHFPFLFNKIIESFFILKLLIIDIVLSDECPSDINISLGENV